MKPRFPASKSVGGGGLDPYDVISHGQMGAPDRNRQLVFGSPGSRDRGRFVYPKVIDRDFTTVGSFSNTMYNRPAAKPQRPSSAPCGTRGAARHAHVANSDRSPSSAGKLSRPKTA